MAENDLPQTFNGGAFLDLIKELVRLDRHWIPQEAGYSLYIRPVMSASLVSQGFAYVC
jgi:branched-chain amino acid aminotransferase